MQDRLVPQAPGLPLSSASTAAVLAASPSTVLHIPPALQAQLHQLEQRVQQLHQTLDHRDAQLVHRVATQER